IGVYELGRGDFSAKITNYGATVVSIVFPDKNGELGDVVLGFPTVDGYKNDTTYFGAIVGRVANRIAGAKFSLNGTVYHLPANDHGNTLHGGRIGFSDVVWNVEEHVEDSHLVLSYDSFDGDQGFPGEISVTVTYLLIGTDRLAIKMQAKPLNMATPINLASHIYWNLGGHSSGDIFSHTLQLFASEITPTDDDLIPTGELRRVDRTPFDFRQPRTIGSHFSQVPGGYDVNYAVDESEPKFQHLSKVAAAREPETGRKLELWSNQPGVQFYSGNMIPATKGKDGAVYDKYAGFCLETQGFPDSVNHPRFPSQVVSPGEDYLHVMVFRFTA
ncbi:hypothetical protein M569_03212, partial [Genlisea aurea]